MNFITKTILLNLLAILAISAGNTNIPTDTKPIAVSALDHSFYMGLGVSAFVLEDGTTAEELSANTVLAIIGYNYNQYIAIEGRYYSSFGDIEYSAGDTQSPDAVYDSEFTNKALFLKVTYPANDIRFYALLGYGELVLTNIAGGDRIERSLQYGVGVSYRVSENIDVFVDWVHAYDDKGFDARAKNDDISVDLLSTGMRYRF